MSRLHSHKKLISEKVSKLCCCMGWKSPLIIATFGARRCNELIFCTDLHEAVLYRIEEVLAAANCAGPWNHSLSGGALKSKQQLSGNLFILFCKLFILKLWLRSFEETVRGKFESFSTSAVSYDGALVQVSCLYLLWIKSYRGKSLSQFIIAFFVQYSW